jgi:4-hydroxy-tetrahydrodipicolinate synthase
MSQRLRGVLAPVITPFHADYSPDAARFVRHCQWLLAHGCDGLAVFGTNSEANSLAASERMDLLERLVAAGVPAAKLMPGTGCCSLTETTELTAHAVKLGCAGVLTLPPFYYKGVPEEGLFRHFSEVIQRVGDARLRLYLYHIPPVAVVPITAGLVARLLDAYPQAVAGLKDSSGDWSNTKGLIESFGARGFDVFAGSEVFLLRTLRAGGAGCITAGANVNPHGILTGLAVLGQIVQLLHEALPPLIVILKFLLMVPEKLSLAMTVKLCVPATVGTPSITPVLACKVSPTGSDPLVTDQL